MDSETVDCIATDPPFNAKRVFNAPLGSRSATQKFDDRWRWDEVTDEWHDVLAADHPAVKEIIEAAAVIEGGSVDPRTGQISTGRVKNSIAAYLAWMAPRIVEMRRVLRPTGVLFLHCDDEATAYLRLLLDAVFGRPCFINEIIRRRALAKRNTRRLPRNHDAILAYGKSRKWKWKPVHKPYDLGNLDEKTLDQYRLKDPNGRRYQLTDLTAAKPGGDTEYEWRVKRRKGSDQWEADLADDWVRPVDGWEYLGMPPYRGRYWAYSRESMVAFEKEGRLRYMKTGMPRFKRYLDEQPGRQRDSLWTDHPVVLPEPIDCDWATRKPVALYRRLIECATEAGNIVLDPFAGCATTCVAAEQLDRCWVGIDIDPVAESETERRLFNEARVNFQAAATLRKSLRRTDIPHTSDEALRLSLWTRQARRCANPYCDSGKLRAVDLELDHRIPKSRGGSDDVLNRIGLCANCNRRKARKAWGLFLDEERSGQPHPN